MRKTLSFAMVTLVTASVMTGCVDDAYDLDDIDTTVEVKINDLTIPVNFDEIELSSVFDIDDENSSIKTIDGAYAFVVEGDFASDRFTIAPVTFNAGSVEKLDVTLVKYNGADLNIPIGSNTVAYHAQDVTTAFKYESDQVDKSIRSLTSIKVDCPVTMRMTVSDDNGLLSSMKLKNLQFKVPAALSTSAYPCTDGVITIGDLDVNLHGTTQVTIPIDLIDFTRLPATDYTFTPRDNAPGSIMFNGQVGLHNASLTATTAATSTAVSQNVVLNLEIIMGQVNVHSFTGTMGYSLDGFDIPTVQLEDIPSFLTDGTTDITLTNPQLYISANNPLAGDKLSAQSGLTLTSLRGGVVGNVCAVPQGNYVVIGHDKGVAGPYLNCLSPSEPAPMYNGYAGARWVEYPTLGGLLAGNGIPTSINVEFNNPCIPPTPVVDFKVNRNIDPFEGDYKLVAPLAFNAGSSITYSEREDGWGDEDLDKLTVTSLKLTATVTNTLPMDITVGGKLLDSTGKQCTDPKTGRPVSLTGFTVAAGATSTITLGSDGTVRDLDGIEYTATAVVTKGGEPLKPTSPIKVSGIKVTVSGSYTDEL